jgi:hypothetical protein
MRPITVQAGPLAASSATKVATAQRPYGTGGALALIGAASDFVAGTVCATQAPGSAALTINGTRVNTGVAYLTTPSYIYINSSGDDHGITFAVVGTDQWGTVLKETITGTNAQSAGSVNAYMNIISITPSGAVAANVTVGSYTKATLDAARYVLFTTTADESANTATIYGTDWAGVPISETLTLVNNSTVATVLNYLTITKVTISAAAAGNISVGTNGLCYSPWVYVDPYAMSQIALQATVSGTANYTVQQSLDDPNNPTNPIAAASMTWVSISDGSLVGASSTQQSNYAYPPSWVRVLVNSQTNPGYVRLAVTQALAVTA